MKNTRSALNINHINKMTNIELKKALIDSLASRRDDAIESDMLFDLIGKYVDLTQELNEKIEEVEQLSIIDPLTGAFNRLKFGRSYEEEQHWFKRHHKTFSIVMFDIDHFKKVNDNFGHAIGDEVLVSIANIVKSIIREIDTFARWGGEEFIILLTDSDHEVATVLAQRIRKKIAAHAFETVGNVTCSFGVSEVSLNDTLEEVCIRADKALYYSKLHGRNQVTNYHHLKTP